MSILLIMAIIFMTLALVFYTIGVFAEKKSGSLLKWHALIFWLGFICDTSGTNIMGQISGHNFNFNLHGITGSIALLLMAFHAVWATVILIKKNDRAIMCLNITSRRSRDAWSWSFVLTAEMNKCLYKV